MINQLSLKPKTKRYYPSNRKRQEDRYLEHCDKCGDWDTYVTASASASNPMFRNLCRFCRGELIIKIQNDMIESTSFSIVEALKEGELEMAKILVLLDQKPSRRLALALEESGCLATFDNPLSRRAVWGVPIVSLYDMIRIKNNSSSILIGDPFKIRGIKNA